jgi:hypothetical protein
MPPAEYELAIPASDQPQTLSLDRSATGVGACYEDIWLIPIFFSPF